MQQHFLAEKELHVLLPEILPMVDRRLFDPAFKLNTNELNEVKSGLVVGAVGQFIDGIFDLILVNSCQCHYALNVLHCVIFLGCEQLTESSLWLGSQVSERG